MFEWGHKKGLGPAVTTGALSAVGTTDGFSDAEQKGCGQQKVIHRQN